MKPTKKRTKLTLSEVETQMEVLTKEEMNTLRGGGDGTYGSPYTQDEYYALFDTNSFYGGYVAGWGYVNPLEGVEVTGSSFGSYTPPNSDFNDRVWSEYEAWKNQMMYGSSNGYGSQYDNGYGSYYYGSDYNSYDEILSYSGGGGGVTLPSSPGVINPYIVTGKAKDVIDTIRNKTGHFPWDETSSNVSHLSKYILDMFSNSNNRMLTFRQENLSRDANGNIRNGYTSKIENGYYEIVLNNDLIKRGSKLSIAKTIIHESVHAFVGLSMENRSTNLAVEISNMYTKYIKEQGLDPSKEKDRAQARNLSEHEFMSQYVEAMAHSLAVYDGHKHDMQYYIDLSWGGLETSPAYKNKPQSEKDRIQKIISYERFKNSNN